MTTNLFRRGRRETAYTVPLYSPGREEVARYRTELNALCTALDAFPSDVYVCVHDLLGGPSGHANWQRWDCSIGQGHGFSAPVRFDHSVTLVANDRSWVAILGQPYADVTDDPADIGTLSGMKPYAATAGVAAEVVGVTPYSAHAVAVLVGRSEVIERIAWRAREVLQQSASKALAS